MDKLLRSDGGTNRSVFVFLFEVVPTVSSPFAGKVGSAEADIWVYHPDRTEAENMARAYVMDYGFQALSVQDEHVMHESEMWRFREDAQALFRQAIARGIAGTFAGSPPVDREDSTLEIHRMEPPHPLCGSKQ